MVVMAPFSWRIDSDDNDAFLDTTFDATADDNKTADNKGINLTKHNVILNEFCVKKVLWALIKALQSSSQFGTES